MALIITLYWRDIPAQVIARAGRKTAKRQLPERFEQAIDRAAMRAKLSGSDAYLEAWRKSEPTPWPEDSGASTDLEGIAAAAADALEAAFPPETLRLYVANGGFAPEV